MVVSIANLSPSQNSLYYEEEENSFRCNQTQWCGRLSALLELPSSRVDASTFDHFLNGRNAQGQVLINKMRLTHDSVTGSARAGIDLTTSAPKSVSIQSLIFNDHRLIEAHQQATRLMLQILENRYAMTRTYSEGKRQRVFTGNLLVAQFLHSSSRALDPQLHSHNIVLNLTLRNDNRWQSLDSELFYRRKMLLGQIYRNDLALAVQALGYKIRITDAKHGLWELQGFADAHLEAFASRAQQIRAAVSSAATDRERERAARFADRPKKQFLPLEDLVQQWRQRANAMQLTALVTEIPLPPSANLVQSIHAAVALYDGQSLVSREQLESTLLALTVGQYRFIDLTTTLGHLLSETPDCHPPYHIQYFVGANHEQTSLRPTAAKHLAPPAPPVETSPPRHLAQPSSTQGDSIYPFQPSETGRTNLRSEPSLDLPKPIAGCSRTAATDAAVAKRIVSTPASPQAVAAEPERNLLKNGWGRLRSQKFNESSEAIAQRTESNNRPNSSPTERTERTQNPVQKVSVSLPPPQIERELER